MSRGWCDKRIKDSQVSVLRAGSCTKTKSFTTENSNVKIEKRNQKEESHPWTHAALSINLQQLVQP